MQFTLKRVSLKSTGTFGVLLDENNDPFAVTLELPWKENKKNISCIPAGTYNAVLSNTQRHGRAWVVLNVPGRQAILIHPGNTTRDTQGCILIGEGFSFESKGKVIIAYSKAAYNEFMAKLAAYDRFTLKILEV